MGCGVGLGVGWGVGRAVGSAVGRAVGSAVGSSVGVAVGAVVGSAVGPAVGPGDPNVGDGAELGSKPGDGEPVAGVATPGSEPDGCEVADAVGPIVGRSGDGGGLVVGRGPLDSGPFDDDADGGAELEGTTAMSGFGTVGGIVDPRRTMLRAIPPRTTLTMASDRMSRTRRAAVSTIRALLSGSSGAVASWCILAPGALGRPNGSGQIGHQERLVAGRSAAGQALEQADL